jgi:hypothetical protein
MGDGSSPSHSFIMMAAEKTVYPLSGSWPPTSGTTLPHAQLHVQEDIPYSSEGPFCRTSSLAVYEHYSGLRMWLEKRLKQWFNFK